ncbi:MAG: TonB-dependent receptor [Gammaproteobacteria bacterium]|nr:TonB-dependent receptor [Gammaproteobacteria bacterium]
MTSMLRSGFSKRHACGAPAKPLGIALAVAMAAGALGASAQGVEEIVVTAEFRAANVQDTPIAITAVNSEMLEARSQTSIYEVAAQAPNVTLKPASQNQGPAMVAFIRGIGQTDFNFALEPGVGLYIDDVYYPTLTGSLVDLMDLDRVEVLRGPQGTLAGKNSIGGAIKMYSKAPGEGGGSLQLTYGSYNRIDVRGTADFEIAEDRLYARVAAASHHQDGYVTRYDYQCLHPSSNVPTYIQGRLKDCKVGSLGGKAYTAGRLQLRWLASDDVTVNLSADITNDDSEAGADVLVRVNEARTVGGAAGPYWDPAYAALQGGTAGYQGTSIPGTDGNPAYLTNAFVPYGTYRGDTVLNDGYASYSTFLDPNPTTPGTALSWSPVAINPQSTLDHWGLSAVIDWDISDNFQLKSITSYRKYDSNWAQDVDNSPINSQMLLQRLEHDQWSEELRLNGSFADGALDFTVGGFFFEQDGTLEANVNLYYAQFNFIHGPDPTPSHNYAGFLHATWHVNDDLNLSAGLRYSDDEKTYTHFRRNPDGTLPAAACGLVPFVAGQGLPEIAPGLTVGIPNWVGQAPNCALFGLYDVSATWADTRLDWRVALDYRWNDNFMTYGQVSTGYKGGGVNPRPFVLEQLLDFNSEVITTYELGFKSTLFDNKMRLNGAVFYNDYTDIIMTLSSCFQTTPATTDGPGPCALPFNAGTAKVPGAELEMEFYPTDNLMIDAAVSYIDFEYKQTVAPITTSMVPPYTPKWKWSAGIQYTFAETSYGAFSARVDAAYQSSINTAAFNEATNHINGYTLANARLMWRSLDETWNAALEITNLTDKYYYLTLTDQYGSAGATVSGQPGMPRVFALTLRRNF